MYAHEELVTALSDPSPGALAALCARADRMRSCRVGEAVHLRGLVEFTNVCRRQCLYCGLRAGNRQLARYRMTAHEIVLCAHAIRAQGLDTIVLQSGEDPALDPRWLANVIRTIVAETELTVTLSVGEWPAQTLALWRRAGARRYLLRFETADPVLYRRLRPPGPGTASSRLPQLRTLRELDYEVGSGIMVGLPGQTADILAHDLEEFVRLDLDMVGLGPFIPHPATPLAGATPPADLLRTTRAVIALTRLLCPDANIPATTAVQTVARDTGLRAMLRAGANVVMPNFTPGAYRARYEIYPGKAGDPVSPAESIARLDALFASLGRPRGQGPGDSPNVQGRRKAVAVQEVHHA